MLKKNLVVLGLGSNLGKRASNIAMAIRYISGFCDIVAVSSVYKTKSLLNDDQNDYFNVCVSVKTDFDHESLLYSLKNIELLMGREPSGRWQNRIIDIDIIDYNSEVFSSEYLNIPHPQMQNRSFVLYPLMEIYPDYKHPLSCLGINDMVKNIHDDLNISKLGVCTWR